MSFDVATTTQFPQPAFQFVPQEIVDENVFEDLPILGGLLSDLKHVWHAKGPCLEVRTTGSGRKVGAWIFGGVVRDSNTKITAVGELKRGYGKLPLLVVALDCPLSGGLICVFDIFGSKVLRVVQIGEQITNIHVVDSACEKTVLPEASPLKYFDGIVAFGTVGGNVYLLDICKQICENALQNMDISLRDEVNPCQMKILKKEKIGSIKAYVERSVEHEEHLAIHLNVVLKSSTDHFTLKGEDGDDRVHVNRTETEVSALFYSPQIASLLVGYNFGAFQMWDLRALDLLYTSPICEGHIPVTHFTVQEPADDPKAYCYIWVSYSHNLLFHSGLPFAVMYSFYFDSKTFVNGYGNLYEDFQHCSIRFQLELGDTQSSTCKSRVKGGTCLGLQSINKSPLNKDLSSLALCLISWLIWDADREINTAVLLFDLNQWYKEQMPRMPDWSHCSNYIIKNSLSEKLLDVKMDQRSLSQFMGIQRLEEHFCPTSLSFYLRGISEDSIFKIHNKGQQKTFLDKLMFDQHIALMKPEDYTEKIVNLGLVPLFCDNSLNSSEDIDSQRDLIFSVCLEQNLVGWLCQTSIKLASNAFFASGLTLYSVLNWAFQRAITLKNACDKYCVPLFDYSGMRLDDNTITLISCSTNQIRNLSSVYQYISSKLLNLVPDKERHLEEQRSLENAVVYFEVLLWMVNIGLLPEYQSRGAVDNLLSAPYLVQELTQYYNKKRVQLQIASRETFVEKDCLLFVDNLINSSGGAEILRQQWQEDGGSGLYPPPSLQSLLRTYFLDGADLVFKHSLVTYTLLDIAMTVDEHNKVIKLLLKFPQIFNVTQSNTKIVQAFWHLDHDDYETASESIMDPSVLLEDLRHWHHAVMMRSLLLQDQSGLALLYLQVRKPTIQDEKDLLTVISLLISKNMLDEAFKFRLQQKGPNDDALLTHIFNECNKNELLHTLLYRRMSADEEQAFFKYLQNTRNSRCEDLKVFYYLLRSRFLEAFDTYSLTKRRQPDMQGLMGQRDASTADNVVKMFKGLLPDVNRNLVELVQKERTNLWREVKKPLPLSVFVHNAKDQVHYKSSVIFAALAKAKQTFNDSLDDTNVGRDVVTEDTPFLMTPRVFRHEPRINTPLMKSRVIEQNEQGEEQYGPSPCKKLKLSPRTSKTSPIKSFSSSFSQSKLTTPIIKRKRQSLEQSNITAILPQSILKSNSRTIVDDSIFDENTSINTSLQAECENSIRRSRLGLTPRKAVRTPLKSHVKFDDLRYSGSSADQSSRNDSNLTDLGKQSKNSTASTLDDVFYSPEHSFETSPSKSKEQAAMEESPVQTQSKKIDIDNEDRSLTAAAAIENTNKPPIIPENDLSSSRLNFQSPKSRRSYKRSFGESPTPVRSSPRLAKKPQPEDVAEDETAKQPSPHSPNVAVQKLRGRRSLSRSVLENNAFSALKSNVSWAPKDLAEKSCSTVSSLNSSIEVNSSFEAFLENQKYIGNTWESSFDTSNSLLMSDKEDDGAEVVSKTTEVINVETRRESLRRKDTGVLVSSNESKEEYHSKTVEVFGDENTEQEPTSKLSEIETNQSTSKENAPDTINSDDEDLGEPEKEDSSIKTSINEQEAEINVYDDLSSASEDIKEILQNRQQDETTTFRDRSFSTSSYQTEKKKSEMPNNIMDGEGSNSSNDARKLEPTYDEDVEMFESDVDIPETEKAFINSEEVIQIDSSSEDASTEENSNSSASSSTYNSDESVKGSSEDNDLNVCFMSNLNEQTATKISNEPIVIDDTIKSVANQSEAESDNDEDMESLILDDQEVVEDTDENTPPEVPKMLSVSLQCTLGDHLATADAENNSFTVESEEKNRKSISLQCTLGDHLNAPANEDSVAVEESLNTPAKVDADATLQLAVHLTKRTYASSEQQGEDNDSADKIEAAVEETAVEMEQVEAAEIHKAESSLQSVPSDELSTLENSALDESTEKNADSDTSIKLRSVKKTYPGRKVVVDVNATPKLAVHLTKRTYSRKGSKIFDEQQREDSDAAANENEEKMEAVAEETDFENPESDKVVETETDVNEAAIESIVTEEDKAEIETAQSEDKNKIVQDAQQESPSASSPAKEQEADKAETEARTEDQSEDQKNTMQDQESSPTSSSTKEEKEAAAPRQMETEARTEDQSEDQKKTMQDQESSPTSSSTKDEKEAAAPRRMTRRSILLAQEATPSSVSEESVASGGSKSSKKQQEAGNHSTPPKKTQQASKRRTRRVLSDIDSHLDAPTEPERLDGDEEAKEQGSPGSKAGSSKIYAKRSSKTSKAKSLSLSKPMKRTRSASVNLPSANTRKRSVRSGSVDLSDIVDSAGKVFSLTPIIEVPTPTKAASHMGDYTTSRRLTRRQANMLEAIGRVEEEAKNLPNLKEIDPLLLLDKAEFEGYPDPDEPNLYEPSSPSRSSDTPSKHTRSASVASDLADVSTPTKKKSKPKVDSGIKTRLRRLSTDTMSVVSEQSDSPSPPKRSRKKDDQAEPKRRARAASVSSTKSVASEKSEQSVRSTRSRRIHSAKSELEEIKEEKGNDEASGDAADTVKKRGRKKKE